MKHEKMKKLTVLAMLSAIAYVAVALLRFPVVLFLSYEPKDVIIAIGGFLYGPLAALGISLVVSFIEMLTISSTGWIGFVMNFLSSAAFAGTPPCSTAKSARRAAPLRACSAARCL